MNVAYLLETLPTHLSKVLARVRHQASALNAEVYLVGGPVRDLILGRPVHDLDFAVAGDGVGFAHALAETAGGRVSTVSLFQTAKVEIAGSVIDIASTRRERYASQGALPSVEPGTISEDLVRRDFTVNSMAVSLHPRNFGLLLDPFNGKVDLENRVLRVLTEDSFQNDATRMLRGVRFVVRLDLRFHSDTKTLVQRDNSMLATISGDRLRSELLHLLKEPKPADNVWLAGDLGLLEAIHPSLGDRDAITGYVAEMETRGGEGVLLLASMFWNLGMPNIKSLVSRLSIRGIEAGIVEQVGAMPSLRPDLMKKDLRPSEIVHLLEGQSIEALEVTATLGRDPQVVQRIRRYLDDWRHVHSVLDGGDLMRLGVPFGPHLGQLLKGLRDARVDEHLLTRAEEENWVRAEQKKRQDKEPGN